MQKKGKLIVIEGTDCSGKETQSNKLVERLKAENIPIKKYSFPNYESPTGKIVGGPYLGKSYICEGWFEEEAPNVDPKVSSLYYAADRKYNIKPIIDDLDKGINVLLDRYTYSSMAHQGGKLISKRDRNKMLKWIEKLEFELLQLPIPDIKIFLHMPTEYNFKLKSGREEASDQNERDPFHLLHSEQAYMEIAKRYNFITIECIDNYEIKTIEQIHEEIYEQVKRLMFEDEKVSKK